LVDGDDIYGDGVNIAACLQALAEPGGICISRVVRDRIRDKLPYIFEDRGEYSIENIVRPVRVYTMRAMRSRRCLRSRRRNTLHQLPVA
jgi:adenylate cyclase